MQQFWISSGPVDFPLLIVPSGPLTEHLVRSRTGSPVSKALIHSQVLLVPHENVITYVLKCHPHIHHIPVKELNWEHFPLATDKVITETKKMDHGVLLLSLSSGGRMLTFGRKSQILNAAFIT
ncbi:hypothetical protein AMECASPLE_034062, partial [Ameca splendens]